MSSLVKIHQRRDGLFNSLVNLMARSDLLRGDLDYHLVRASMVIIFLFFGYQKWFEYEAQVLIPYISNGPLIFWMYPVFGIRGASWFLGVAEWLFGALLFLGFWDKRLGILGAAGSTATFIGTVTIIPFMSNGWAESAGGFPAMTGNVPFLMKDVVLLAASLYLLKQDVMRLPLHQADHRLDEALRQTFSASDPFSLSRDNGPVYASPPCFLRDVDPAYLGYLSTAETIALLNQLLEGERAGARGIAEIVRHGAGVSNPSVLPQIASDEGRFCAMLTRHITRLGGTPSPRTGSFYEKLIALGKPGERIDFLNRGQAWVVRKLQEVLPSIGDSALHDDLKNMLVVHERNIQRCTDLR